MTDRPSGTASVPHTRESGPGLRIGSGVADRVPAWSMAVTAMLSVQLGAALSVHMFDEVGPAGIAWLRLSAGALIFLGLRRPRLRRLGWRGLRAVLALGVTTGLVTTSALRRRRRSSVASCRGRRWTFRLS